jgi:hypothetical protein
MSEGASERVLKRWAEAGGRDCGAVTIQKGAWTGPGQGHSGHDETSIARRLGSRWPDVTGPSPRKPARTRAFGASRRARGGAGLVALAAEMLAADGAIVWAGGRYTSNLEDARPLGILMEDTG